MEKRLALIDSNRFAARGMQLLLEDSGIGVIAGADAAAVRSEAVGELMLSLIVAEHRLTSGGDGFAEALALRAACGWDVPILLLASRLNPPSGDVAKSNKISIVFTPVDTPVLLAAILGCIKEA